MAGTHLVPLPQALLLIGAGATVLLHVLFIAVLFLESGPHGHTTGRAAEQDRLVAAILGAAVADAATLSWQLASPAHSCMATVERAALRERAQLHGLTVFDHPLPGDVYWTKKIGEPSHAGELLLVLVYALQTAHRAIPADIASRLFLHFVHHPLFVEAPTLTLVPPDFLTSVRRALVGGQAGASDALAIAGDFYISKVCGLDPLSLHPHAAADTNATCPPLVDAALSGLPGVSPHTRTTPRLAVSAVPAPAAVGTEAMECFRVRAGADASELHTVHSGLKFFVDCVVLNHLHAPFSGAPRAACGELAAEFYGNFTGNPMHIPDTRCFTECASLSDHSGRALIAVVPVAVAHFRDPDLLDAVSSVVRITTRSSAVEQAAWGFATLLDRLFNGHDLASSIDYINNMGKLSSETRGWFSLGFSKRFLHAHRFPDLFCQDQHVRCTLPATVQIFSKFGSTKNFTGAVLAAMAIGGDIGTTATLAGALMAASAGTAVLPREWTDRVARWDRLFTATSDIVGF